MLKEKEKNYYIPHNLSYFKIFTEKKTRKRYTNMSTVGL